METLKEIDDYLASNKDRYERELFDFLRIPSVSADSRHAGDIKAAAQFVKDRLTDAGIEARIVPTKGHPLVVGERLGVPGAMTLLIYGHYDVQPPDPLDLWVSGPFEPTVRNGNVYARGATDDKGQSYSHIKAVEAWMKTAGKLPINVKFLIEGEEEVGSAAIAEYVKTHQKELACDYVAISDGGMFALDRPAITYGLRGIAYFELLVDGPQRDLHSGTFGGSVQNPINALVEILATLKDKDGKIQLPGFYDDVDVISAEERAQFQQLSGPDEEPFRKEIGAPALFGEKGFSTLERRWVRPTCDINGIFGGYQGEGAKTVIAAKAGAKVSFRLVPHQDPDKVGAAFAEHVKRVCPPGVNYRIITHHGAEAAVVPLGSAGIHAAARALQAAFGVAPVYTREGGSIPIVSLFKSVLGVDSLLLGYGLNDDNTHSPNEKFRLLDYHRGIKANAHLLAELAKEK